MKLKRARQFYQYVLVGPGVFASMSKLTTVGILPPINLYYRQRELFTRGNTNVAKKSTKF